MKNKTLLNTALQFGLPFGIFVSLLLPMLLTGEKSYVGDDSVSALLFGLTGCALLFMFFNYTRKPFTKEDLLPHLLIMTLIFSATVSAFIGLSHYVNATFIDPDWSQNALAAMQEKWAAANYSPEEIAGQIEWTDTFLNPWKWASVYFIFFSIMFSLLGSIIASCFYFLYKVFRKRTQAMYV